MDIEKIMAFEEGELSANETIGLFSNLVKSGTAWKLQGVYGRTAVDLIDAGYIEADGSVSRYLSEDA